MVYFNSDIIIYILIVVNFLYSGGIFIFSTLKDLFTEYGFIGAMIRLVIIIYPYIHYFLFMKKIKI